MTNGDSGVTSVTVRDELEKLLERDLLGPWDGPEEELPFGTSPAERYLVGRLVPASAPPPGADPEAARPEPETVEAEAGAVDEPTDAEAEPEATIRSGSRAASSMGLSFQVPGDVDTVAVTARSGRYERGPSQTQETEQGRPRTVWVRRARGGPVEVDCSAPGDATRTPDPLHEQVELRCTVRHRSGRCVVDLTLVDNQPAPSSTPDTARLYQVQLQVTALDGAQAIFLGHNDPAFDPPAHPHDDERRTLAMLYREAREYAHGRQCAVDAEAREGEQRAWRLTTTSFPSADVPLVVPGDTARMPGLVLDMARLGSPELARDDLVRALRPLVTGYRGWRGEQEGRLDDPEVRVYSPSGEHALGLAREVADRLDRAVDLLRDNGLAREAFRFANQAMALQRVRGEVTRARLADPDSDPDELLRRYEVPAHRSCVRSSSRSSCCACPGSPTPSTPTPSVVPTTDAYSSCSSPPAAARPRPTSGLPRSHWPCAVCRGSWVGEDARDGTDGVAVLMRYTLRLLTAQQFQRAAALICACEWLRRERLEGGDGRWGTVPFRLGLWVGVSVTPSSYENAKQEVADKRGQTTGTGGVLQLAACPWCGLELAGSRDVTTEDTRQRVLTHCPDPEGACPFSQRQSPREGLPVVTVDEELYRLTPSLVISTVDKFAQLPWKAATATLFGQVDAQCPRHGWSNPDFLGFCKTKHPAAGGLPATQLQPAMRLRPPDLVIQDELHLISDALGSMVGLFETVVDDLCARRSGSRLIRPVLVASTATVRRAADQVEQVFARKLTVFPPRVLPAPRRRCRGDLLLHHRRPVPDDAGEALPRHLRAGRDPQVRRDPSHGLGPRARPGSVRPLRSRRRPVHDGGRLLHLDPRARGDAPAGRR